MVIGWWMVSMLATHFRSLEFLDPINVKASTADTELFSTERKGSVWGLLLKFTVISTVLSVLSSRLLSPPNIHYSLLKGMISILKIYRISQILEPNLILVAMLSDKINLNVNANSCAVQSAALIFKNVESQKKFYNRKLSSQLPCHTAHTCD